MGDDMILRASILLGLAMVVNHLVHGWACWGFRPAGYVSMWIYGAQLVVAGMGSVVAVYRALREDLLGDARRVVVYGVIAGVAFGFWGIWAFSSARVQVPYSPLAFFAAWVSGMVAGVTLRRMRRVTVAV